MHIYLHLVKFVKYIFVLNIIFTCLQPTLGRLPQYQHIYFSVVSSCGHFCRLHQALSKPPDPRSPTTISWDVDASRWECWNIWSFYNPFIVFRCQKVRSKGCLVNVSLNTFGILAYNLAGIIWPNNITTRILKTLYHHCWNHDLFHWLPSIRPNHRFHLIHFSPVWDLREGPIGIPRKNSHAIRYPPFFSQRFGAAKIGKGLVACSGNISLGFLRIHH